MWPFKHFSTSQKQLILCSFLDAIFGECYRIFKLCELVKLIIIQWSNKSWYGKMKVKSITLETPVAALYFNGNLVQYTISISNGVVFLNVKVSFQSPVNKLGEKHLAVADLFQYYSDSCLYLVPLLPNYWIKFCLQVLYRANPLHWIQDCNNMFVHWVKLTLCMVFWTLGEVNSKPGVSIEHRQILRGAFKRDFQKSLAFCPQGGGGI